MQAQIRFRPLTAADYNAVTTLWRECDGIEVAEGDDETSFRTYLERNPELSHCAEADGSLVGAALCGHDGRRGLIYHLAVAAAFRGHGVATEILTRGLTGMREQGIGRALVLVAKGNSPGQEFWLSQGFENISGALPLGMDLT